MSSNSFNALSKIGKNKKSFHDTWSEKHVQGQVPQTQQALEQSHKPTTTINHSSRIWENTTSTQNAPNPCVIDVERGSIFKQQSKANILFCCFIRAPHLPVCPWDECKTPQDFRQVTEPVKSQWDSCPQAREKDEMLSGYSRWTQAGENRLYLSSAFATALNLLNVSHFIAFFSLATNSPALYFHHLTHIQNCFLVGAAPETQSKPLIQLQITDWKSVTSALGHSASHSSSSSPRSQGDTLFFMTFTHPLSYDQLIISSHQLLCQGIGFSVSTNT